jgi:hypothetical protein
MTLSVEIHELRSLVNADGILKSISGPNGGNMNVNRGNNEQGNSYYGGRGNVSRPESFMDNPGSLNNQYNPHHQYSYYGGRPPRPRYNDRMNTDPGNHASYLYPQQPYQRSSEIMTAGSGSGGSNATDQGGNHTDPSSVNSSLDRLQPQHVQQKPDRNVPETYGFNGFGPGLQLDASFPGPNGQDHGAPIPPPHGAGERYVYGDNNAEEYGQAAPPPPPKDSVPSTSATGGGGRSQLQKLASGHEKRVSWLKRRFSKN